MSTTWEDFLEKETLFGNAIRLRNFIWIIQQYIPVGKKVLEVGFGSGATSVLLADMGYLVTAMDINENLVSRLRSRYPQEFWGGKLDIRIGDMLSLPWSEKVFDVAVHQGVLEHFSDAEILLALKEQSRVANWVIFDVPNHRYRQKNFGDERFHHPKHWRMLFNQAGLTLVAEYGRVFHFWSYLLPNGLFSHRGLLLWPWVSRSFAMSSIFVCKPKND